MPTRKLTFEINVSNQTLQIFGTPQAIFNKIYLLYDCIAVDYLNLLSSEFGMYVDGIFMYNRTIPANYSDCLLTVLMSGQRYCIISNVQLDFTGVTVGLGAVSKCYF